MFTPYDCTAPFVQIVAVSSELYALDAMGNVWELIHDLERIRDDKNTWYWRPLKADRQLEQ